MTRPPERLFDFADQELQVVLESPHRVARMGLPSEGRESAVLQMLEREGFRAILSLEPVGWPITAAATFALDCVPVEDSVRDRPRPHEIAASIAFLRAQYAEGRATVVHCTAGLGRTGTVLACYLRDFAGELGLTSADDAIGYLRRFHGEMVEWPQQEKRVRGYWDAHPLEVRVAR